MTWKNNMSQKSEPEIKKMESSKSFTCVKWLTDFAKFGITHLSEDMV
jgi:hypothetical protein